MLFTINWKKHSLPEGFHGFESKYIILALMFFDSLINHERCKKYDYHSIEGIVR